MEVLTAKEAAAELKTSNKTIYRLVATGGMGYIKVGRQIRIPRLELERFLSRHMVTAGENK